MSTSVNCPSCRGTGRVSAEEAVRIYEGRASARPAVQAGARCSCDGPPHPYDPLRPDPANPGRNLGWCPPSGPVGQQF